VTWSRISGTWLVTALAAAGKGTTAVLYDQQGRAASVAAPIAGTGTPAVCTSPTSTGCASISLQYATQTTAVAGTPGDYAGQAAL
jgi:hypothetical protein